MKVTLNGEKLVIEVEPEGHDAQVMRSGRPGFFGRKWVRRGEKAYLVQVLGDEGEAGQPFASSPMTGQLCVEIEEWVVFLTLAISAAIPHLEDLEALHGKVVQILLCGAEAGQEQD